MGEIGENDIKEIKEFSSELEKLQMGEIKGIKEVFMKKI